MTQKVDYLLQEHQRVASEVLVNDQQGSQLLNYAILTIGGALTAVALTPDAFALVPLFLYVWALRNFTTDRDTLKLRLYKAHIENRLADSIPGLNRGEFQEDLIGDRSTNHLPTRLTSAAALVLAAIMKVIAVAIIAARHGLSAGIGYAVLCLCMESASAYLAFSRESDRLAIEHRLGTDTAPYDPRAVKATAWRQAAVYVTMMAAMLGTTVGVAFATRATPPDREAELVLQELRDAHTEIKWTSPAPGFHLAEVHLRLPHPASRLERYLKHRTLLAAGTVQSTDPMTRVALPSQMLRSSDLTWTVVACQCGDATVNVVVSWSAAGRQYKVPVQNDEESNDPDD